MFTVVLWFMSFLIPLTGWDALLHKWTLGITAIILGGIEWFDGHWFYPYWLALGALLIVFDVWHHRSTGRGLTEHGRYCMMSKNGFIAKGLKQLLDE